MHAASENRPIATGASHCLWFEAALVSGEWREQVRLSVADGIITGIEVNVEPQPGDERCPVGVPGLVNLHSHAFQRGMSGLAEVHGPAADSFWTWREIMYHFLDRLTPEDMEAIAALAYVEMLESGFTRVGEFHYVHHDCNGLPYANPGELCERIGSAAHTAGINLTLLPSFYAHANFGGLEPTPGQRRFVTSLDQFAQLFEHAGRTVHALPGATIGVAPHSLRAVTAAELRELIALAAGYPIHLHAAEQLREVADCVAATGARPVEWLLANVPLGPRWCLIHATHMTPEEVTGLAKSGATAGLCPITEANLGDGVFSAIRFLAQGGSLGIGTDSNVEIDAPGELRLLEYTQRLMTRQRNVFAQQAGNSTGRSLFDLAASGGNRALGCPHDGLSIGAPADIVTLACDYESLAARERQDALLDRWIFGGQRGCTVRDVWVRGRRVVAGGHHSRRDEILARFRVTLKRVLSV